MLQLVTDRPDPDGPSLSAPRVLQQTLTVEVPPGLAKYTAPVALAGCSQLANDLRQIMRTRQHIQVFVRKIDQLVTCMYPGLGGQGMLLRDVIDAATRGYLVSSTSRVGLDGARFLASAVAVAARGVLAYRAAVLCPDGSEIAWSLMHAESLRAVIERTQATQVRFDAQGTPDAATIWAAKSLVVTRTCQFEDVVLMERAGLDYRAHDAV